MYYDQQIEALNKARWYVSHMRFKAGKLKNFGIKVWQTGFLITIEAIIQIHLFMKNQFNEPYLLPYFCSQDELEQRFSVIRGLGDSHTLHPSPLQFYQRLGQVQVIIHTIFAMHAFRSLLVIALAFLHLCIFFLLFLLLLS